jgi:hypothetical protein
VTPVAIDEIETAKDWRGALGDRNWKTRSFNPAVAFGEVRSVNARSGGYCSEKPSCGSVYAVHPVVWLPVETGVDL